MKGERMAKRSSLGTIFENKLSDITNSQSAESGIGDGKVPEISKFSKDYIDRLMKEKMTMTRVITERNKIIQWCGVKIQKLRDNVQKLQLGNRCLAQSNSQMLAELNLGREKVKTLQHEIVCKDALLKAKNLELEGKQENNEKADLQEGEKAERQSSEKANGNSKACNRKSRRHATKSHSMGPSTTNQTEVDKVKVENKRRCLRRQSARFKSHEWEQAEDLLEIEDARFTVGTPMLENGPTLLSNSSNGKQKRLNCLNPITEAEAPSSASQRWSIGRSLRIAAEKVESYKEIPLNIKMRRHD